LSKQHRLLTGAEHFAETMVTRADNLNRARLLPRRSALITLANSGTDAGSTRTTGS
jgi:hypothetical protein